MNDQTKIAAAHKNVFCAIAASQLEFGTVTKGATNPAFKSKYANLADVAGVVIPVLARHGVCVIQYLVGDDLGAMRTEFVHGDSETRVSCDVPLLVDRQNMQGMKSATTYAKRIGLESLSGVAPEDDDGNAAAQAAAPRQQRQQRQDPPKPQQPAVDADAVDHALSAIEATDTLDALKAIWSGLPQDTRTIKAVKEAKDRRKSVLMDEANRAAADIGEDEIPYEGR